MEDLDRFEGIEDELACAQVAKLMKKQYHAFLDVGFAREESMFLLSQILIASGTTLQEKKD